MTSPQIRNPSVGEASAPLESTLRLRAMHSDHDSFKIMRQCPARGDNTADISNLDKERKVI
uniref:Uncharacterized protein n=2 Tax=Anguilla anguilla TaxID=7936 RepID=A0A0E9TF52_ANGAN